MSERARFHGVLRLVFEGPLLVGGHSPRTGDLDAATAVDRQGVPIVPATALKGALREAAVQVLHYRHPGTVPAPWDSRKELGAEDLAQAQRLDALFGPPGPGGNHLLTGQPSPGAPGGVRIGDARPVKDQQAKLATRHGVSIDRWTRARSRGRLFRRQVAEARGVTFEAPVRGHLSREAVELLRDAAALVEGIGNSQSRGGGRVRVELVEGKAPSVPSLSVARGIAGGVARVEIELLEPLHCGGPSDGGNVRTALRCVPGSALRGALVAAAQLAGLKADALWAESFHASDLWPIEREEAASGPPPRTVYVEKDGPPDQKPKDYVIEEALRRALAAQGIGSLKPTAPALDAPDVGSLRTRLVTRLARDPATRGPAPGQLHVREQALEGQKFAGVLVGLEGAALSTIRALADDREPITIGALRHRGLGQVKVHLGPLPTDKTQARLSRFQEHARRRLRGLEALIPWNPAHLVQLVARTPLLVDDPAEAFRELFAGASIEIRGQWQRHGVRGGWDDLLGRPLELATVLEPGSTWLLEVAGGVTPHLGRLQRASAAGIGKWTEHGLGRIDVCPHWN